jgi:hypothetical protein
MPEDFVESLKQTAALPVEGGYGEVALLANELVEVSQREGALSASIEKRREEIKNILAETPKKDLKALGEVEDLKHTMTALLSLVVDAGEVKEKALELYLRRLNFAYLLTDFETVKSSGDTWGMMYDFDYPGAGSASKQGAVLVVKSLSDLEQSWPADIKKADSVQIIVANSSLTLDDSTCASLLNPIKSKLAEIGCEDAYVTLQSETERPFFVHYTAPSWDEVKLMRNVRPSYEVVLELCTLQKEYEELSVIDTTRRSGLFLGTKNGAEGLLVRTVANEEVSMTNLEQIVYDRSAIIFPSPCGSGSSTCNF